MCQPNFTVATGATIHEEDTTPADIVGGTPATPVKSYFQVDAIALKMTLNASWGMRVPQHVSIVEGVSW